MSLFSFVNTTHKHLSSHRYESDDVLMERQVDAC